MKKPISPCLNCNNRHSGCHSECNIYKDFVKLNIEFKQTLNIVAQNNNIYIDYMRNKYSKRSI